jgi:hypothetical protein
MKAAMSGPAPLTDAMIFGSGEVVLVAKVIFEVFLAIFFQIKDSVIYRIPVVESFIKHLVAQTIAVSQDIPVRRFLRVCAVESGNTDFPPFDVSHQPHNKRHGNATLHVIFDFYSQFVIHRDGKGIGKRLVHFV